MSLIAQMVTKSVMEIDASASGRGHHAHLIEFGTKERTSRFGSRGRVRRQPFMRPAFDQLKQRSLNKIIDVTKKEIDKVARK